MSEQAQHTPDCEQIGNLVRSSMAPTDPNAPRGVLIAEFRDGYGLPHTDEAKANAALFIAAPGLLAELDMIRLSFGGGRVITFSDSDIERIEAACAKARGQS